MTALLIVSSPNLSSASSQVVGFKELQLGMAERAVPKIRKLGCKAGDNFVSTASRKTSSKIEREKKRLEAISYFGDRYCSISSADTVGGMPIVEMRLSFLRGELGKIEMNISEKGISRPTGRGYGEWSSDNLVTLVSSLTTKYGHPNFATERVCASNGGCRGAPNKNTFIWAPAGATVTLSYVESTVNTSPTLTFLSEKFTAETSMLKIQARSISNQIEQEERAKNSSKLLSHSNDL